jgi:glycolate oxidase
MAYNKITSDILTAIKQIVGDKNIITDYDELTKYSHDETEDLRYYPEVVAKPNTPQQVSLLLTLCNQHLIPVTPRGQAPGLAVAPCRLWVAW